MSMITPKKSFGDQGSEYWSVMDRLFISRIVRISEEQFQNGWNIRHEYTEDFPIGVEVDYSTKRTENIGYSANMTHTIIIHSYQLKGGQKV